MKTDRFLKEELQKINVELSKHSTNKFVELPAFTFDEIDLSELLNFVQAEKIFYFKSKYKKFSFLGIGHSKTIKASDVEIYLEEYPSDFLIAAFLFEENPTASEFILPEWVFITRGDQTELSIYPGFECQTYSTSNLIFNLDFTISNYNPNYNPNFSPWVSYEEFPEHDQWSEMINKCDSLFNERELEKIVLSRKKIFNYSYAIDPIHFFKKTLEKNNNANSSYAIFYQMSFDKAFISLTPEKLFSIKGQDFESISLASSAPRGMTIEEDQAFEKLLNENEKLVREHHLVTEEILKKIRPLSETISVSEIQTMKLPYIQHRSTPISAKLLEGFSALEIIKLLHPTPAIGGLPSEKAQEKILEIEPYTRKSYAAPIGVISSHYSELAVGIRSALIEGERITLFGGAGIVKGSIAEEEWIETGLKMNPFLKVVNNE